MNEHDIDNVIMRTIIGVFILLLLVPILLLIGELISSFGFLPFVGILLGLGVFLFLSHWVGKCLWK